MLQHQKPVRIAVVTHLGVRGGTEKQVLYMLRVLAHAGVSVRVYPLTLSEYYQGALEQIGSTYQRIPRYRQPVFRLAALVRQLVRFRPHVIQATHSFANLYAALAGYSLGALSIGSLRSQLSLSRSQNGSWTKWLMKAPDALIVNSASIAEQLVDEGLVSASRVYRLPNTIDLAAYRAQLRTTGTEAPLVVFSGRMIRAKRLDIFLKAVAKAREEHREFRAAIIGVGPAEKSMRQLARRLGLADGCVEFLGQPADLPSVLRRASMLVLCSDSEGFPNVILEGMATGLPIVATPVGEVPRLVEENATGHLIPTGNVNRLAETMVHLARSPMHCRRLGEEGRRRVEKLYGIDTLAQRLLSIYAQVAEQRRRIPRPALASALRSVAAQSQ